MPSSDIYMVFEDDVVPGRYYSPETMDQAMAELREHAGEVDMAYLGSNVWQSVLYSAPVHRKTEHFIDKAFSGLQAAAYTSRGLRTVLPVLEKRLAELEATPAPTPEHVDMFLERTSLVRWQIVPYQLDQNRTQPSSNEDACGALPLGGLFCGAVQLWLDQNGVHEHISYLTYQAGTSDSHWLCVFVCVGILGAFFVVLLFFIICGGPGFSKRSTPTSSPDAPKKSP